MATSSLAHPSPSVADRADHRSEDSLEDVRRAFLGLEAELDLFSWRAHGWPVWEALRVEAFDRLIARLGLLGPKQAVPDRSMRGYLGSWPSALPSVLTRNPFVAGPADLLWIGHPRRKLEADGTWWDPYCDPAIEAVGASSLLVERPHLLRHRSPARTSCTASIAHLDALALAACAGRLIRRPRPPAELTGPAATVEAALREAFGVEVPLCGLAAAKLALRDSQLPWWRRLLRRVRPRAVFLVVSYGNEIGIEACRSMGIPTVELQHGLISRQNLGYHFPLPGCRKTLFPDQLWTFGDAWNTAASLPIDPDRVVSVGFRYLEVKRDAARRDAGPSDGRRRVVFLSARAVCRGLSRIAIDLAATCPDIEVVYKLHPGELDTWRAEMPDLVSSPVRVIEGDDPHLYSLFCQSEAQVGVYSTALFEGMAFGLRTFVAELPGHEPVVDLCSGDNSATLVADAAALRAALQAPAGAGPAGADRFFARDAAGNLRSALRRLLASS